jgi:hypothetical protein
MIIWVREDLRWLECESQGDMAQLRQQGLVGRFGIAACLAPEGWFFGIFDFHHRLIRN